MGKSTHFTGQPVYSQVLNLLNKAKIRKISNQIAGSEAYVKRLDGYTHLVVMLFGVLKHFDSLRELEVGMKAEVNKLCHLGIDYVMRRSTLDEANKRRPQEFFARVYADLLEQYGAFLADSRPKREEKEWEKMLYMMDATTITLFDNLLKGVHLPQSSTLAMDRAYIDFAPFQRLTEEGVCYVTKMKKNLIYKELSSCTYVTPEGLLAHKDSRIVFEKGKLRHESRRVKLWYKDNHQ